MWGLDAGVMGTFGSTSTASRAVPVENDRVVAECVEALPARSTGIRRPHLSSVVESLRRDDLRLLQADKDGGFVVLSSHECRTNADTADTIFGRPRSHQAKAKKLALQKCDEVGLLKLSASIKGSKEVCLSAFFTVKPHKESSPFQVIVSEVGSWQRCLDPYLMKGLKLLEVDDPFLIRKPSGISTFLEVSCPTGVQAFSVDIKDLYSLPQAALTILKKAGFSDQFLSGLAEVILKEPGKTAKPGAASDGEVIWVMRLAIVAVGALATYMALTAESVYALWYLSSDLVYVILFPQLLSVVYLKDYVNTYGSLAAYLVGSFFRAGGGEALLGIPAFIRYPYYDDEMQVQRFPFRTFAMCMCFITLLVVSFVASWLFNNVLPTSLDIFSPDSTERRRPAPLPADCGRHDAQQLVAAVGARVIITGPFGEVETEAAVSDKLPPQYPGRSSVFISTTHCKNVNKPVEFALSSRLVLTRRSNGDRPRYPQTAVATTRDNAL
ncbi:hypothetical protein HPB52_009265 [Rhipicephalus sanguineus]|uniref:Uncharacterized protein n=1 Tax=Rhipicephalus sanguineus TaxID=34632 RepID=A0A9D4Q5S1_RHISA|nr:hypothetical protein HPB52_009265 [Rhipicephalus sanguineus]